jgi:hypothetical protein
MAVAFRHHSTPTPTSTTIILLPSLPLDPNQWRNGNSTGGKSRLQRNKEEILPFRILTQDMFWDRTKAPLMAMEKIQPPRIQPVHPSMTATSRNMPPKADQMNPQPPEHMWLASQGDNIHLWNRISTRLRKAREVIKGTFLIGYQWDVTYHSGILERPTLRDITISHLQNHWVRFLLLQPCIHLSKGLVGHPLQVTRETGRVLLRIRRLILAITVEILPPTPCLPDIYYQHQ